MACETPPAAGPRILAAAGDRLDEVLALERVVFADPWPAVAFDTELHRPWSWFRLLGPPAAGGVVAAVQAYQISWLLAGNMHLLKMAVWPKLRRQGLGRRLLDDVLAEFARRGGGRAGLEVRRSNRAARAFYAAAGFEPVGECRAYYRNGEDAMVLLKRVAPADELEAG